MVCVCVTVAAMPALPSPNEKNMPSLVPLALPVAVVALMQTNNSIAPVSLHRLCAVLLSHQLLTLDECASSLL